jgi:hypothetical protein
MCRMGPGSPAELSLENVSPSVASRDPQRRLHRLLPLAAFRIARGTARDSLQLISNAKT